MRRYLLIFLGVLALTFSPDFLQAQEQVSNMTFKSQKLGTTAGRTWETDSVTVKLDGATNVMTVIGYFPSSGSDPTQELTLRLYNFDGVGTYQLDAVGDSIWEDRNSGDGFCHWVSGQGEVTIYDLSTNTLEGTFRFVCESTPKTGTSFKTVIDGSFIKGLETKITSPEEGDILEPGKEWEITWQAPGRDKVDVVLALVDPEYEEELKLIEAGVLASDGSVVFDVYDTLSPNAYILLFDPEGGEDPIAVSEKFRIRGPRLAKLADESEIACPDCNYYTTYEPSIHGWKFLNGNDSLFNPEKRSNAFQYNYSSGTDPFTKERYTKDFDGAPVSSYPEWPNWVNAFTQPVCYESAVDTTRARKRVVRRWRADADKYEGSCFGMSIASALAFYQPEKFYQAFPGIGSLENAKSLGTIFNSSPEILDLISTLYAYQFGEGYILTYYYAINTGEGPLQVVEDLKKRLAEDLTDLSYIPSVVLSIIEDEEGGGGHSVMAYKVLEEEDNPIIKIFVYDPNWPEETNLPDEERSYITVNSETNTWEYNLNGADRIWGGEIGMLTTNPLHRYLEPAMFPSQESMVALQSRLSIDAQKSNGQGFRYSVDKGFSSTDPEAVALYPMNGPGSPYGYTLSDEPYTTEITANQESGIRLDLFRKELSFSYSSNATDGETDRVAWDEKGMTIHNPGSTPRTFDFEALFDLPTAERTIKVADVDLAGGDSIRFEVVEDDLRISNYGAATRYTVSLSQTSDGSYLEGEYDPVDIGKGDVHTIDPKWGTLSWRLPIYVGITGSSDADTIYRINHLLGVEDGRATEISSIQVTTPLTDQSILTLSLAEPGIVRVDAHDIQGRRVATLFEGKREEGNARIPIDASGLESGQYLLRVMVNNQDVGSVSAMRVE